MSVFVLVCMIHVDNLPIGILAPQVACWWKAQHVPAMEATEHTGSEIADSTRHKKLLHPSKNLYEWEHIKT